MEFPVEATDLIRSNHEFIVLSHVRPDGDAYGTALALTLSLKAAGKQAHCFNQDGLTSSYRFLPGSELVQSTPAEWSGKHTVIIAVDTANFERLGKNFIGWGESVHLNLDHHLGNQRYGKINLIDPAAPASSQVLFQFLKFCGLPCPPDVAANLFVGISTDTGSFRFRQTSSETFRIAAALADTGIDVASLAQSCYQSHPASRLKLLREVLNVVQFRFDNRVAYYQLTRAMFERSGSSRDETEGLIETLQSTESVEVAFVLEEVDSHRTRVSLRSRGRIDVNQLASEFGGGGHALASGINAPVALADLEKSLLARLETLLA